MVPDRVNTLRQLSAELISEAEFVDTQSDLYMYGLRRVFDRFRHVVFVGSDISKMY